ncbi:MAG: hypothetical protein LBE83_00430 [Propionibacteriaceae bacterium]|jgi:hypothetical protein|nr:hypothetical protein [Propionibacteriaceae bacterium]
MPKMTVDVDAIGTLASDLESVATDFESAKTDSTKIAGAVGHSKLSDTVKDFASKWEITRGKMTEAMRGLADTATMVQETWIQIDEDGAKSLTDKDAMKGVTPAAKTRGPVASV